MKAYFKAIITILVLTLAMVMTLLYAKLTTGK